MVQKVRKNRVSEFFDYCFGCLLHGLWICCGVLFGCFKNFETSGDVVCSLSQNVEHPKIVRFGCFACMGPLDGVCLAKMSFSCSQLVGSPEFPEQLSMR